MVKNTIGGKKGKMMANKRSGSGGDKKLRLSMNEDEIYVCVSKVFGGGLFEVMNNEGGIFKAHLRGKMKGPNKRHNFVSLFSILLVGKRSDLSDSLNCDILFVYDDHDVLSISLLPNLNISNILSFHHNHSISEKNNNDDLFLNNNNISSCNSGQNIHVDMDKDMDIDFNEI
jgi:hypothetical protein